jgi:uncharacterized protein (DUF2336 family)
MTWIETLFPKTFEKLNDSQEKIIAREGSEGERRKLAQNPATSQEVLYYLAQHDPSVKVRKDVAKNPSTPLQAAPILAKDKDSDVRLRLARRVMVVLPDLNADKYAQLYAFAVQALGMLALDEVLKIRRALSETLKDHAHTPPSVAALLAKDVERSVAEPILRFCTALSDDDLVDILSKHPAPWAAQAAARRSSISARVSRAIIDTGHKKAGRYLLQNDAAEIDESLLEEIIERAHECPEWHRPIALRKTLPPLMARKLAAFVSKQVQQLLLDRTDLDKQTIAEITSVMNRRMEYMTGASGEARDEQIARAKKLFEEKALTDDVVQDAIAARDRIFVVAALAFSARTRIQTIETIFEARAAKTLCALCWRARFSMRTAFQLQQSFACVPTRSLIYPRGGSEYPFTPEEMGVMLDVAGVR